MFFSHEILQRRGGRFGIIWIAATDHKRLKRKEYSSVDVKKTCKEIMEFICLQAAPLHEGGTRPRFSLYLSSQLMFGVISVYEKQCNYIMSELKELMAKVNNASISSDTIKIDLKADLGKGKKLTMPDPTLFASMDPLFGKIDKEDTFAMFHLHSLDLSPYHKEFPPILTSPIDRKNLNTYKPDETSPHTVSSSDEISLKDDSPPSFLIEMLKIQEKDELPAVDNEADSVFQQLMLENFPEFDDGLLDPIEGTGSSKKSKEEEGVIAEVELNSSPERQTAGKKGKKRVGIDSQDKNESSRKKRKMLHSEVEDGGGLSPKPQTTPPGRILNIQEKVLREQFNLIPIEEVSGKPQPKRQRRARKSLGFIDETATRLTPDDIRNNLKDPKSQCFTLSDMFNNLEKASRKYPSANALLRQPGRKNLHHDLIDIWKQNAKVKPIEVDQNVAWCSQFEEYHHPPELDDSLSPKSMDSLSEKEEKSSISSLLNLPDVERLRMSYNSTQSHISMAFSESSEKETSFRSLPRLRADSGSSLANIKRRSTMAILKEEAIEERLDGMDLVEWEVEEFEEPKVFEDGAQLSPGVILEDPEIDYSSPPLLNTGKRLKRQIMRNIAELTSSKKTTNFKALVPLTTPKPIAVKMFTNILDYAALNMVNLYQAIAYGEIVISRGKQF